MSILDVKNDVSYCVGGFGEGLDHPECITWGSDGYAYAGGEGGQIYRIDVENNHFEQFAQAPNFVGGLCQDGSGSLYICSGNKVYKVNNDGNLTEYSSGTPDVAMIGPNYPAFDKNGNLYVTDSGGWKKDNGKIFKISPGRQTEVGRRFQILFRTEFVFRQVAQTCMWRLVLIHQGLKKYPLMKQGKQG